LDIVIVDEYALELLSLGGVPTVFGSCVSTGSLTQEGSVEPSTIDGLCVTLGDGDGDGGGFVFSTGTTGTLSSVVHVTRVGEVDVTVVMLL